MHSVHRVCTNQVPVMNVAVVMQASPRQTHKCITLYTPAKHYLMQIASV